MANPVSTPHDHPSEDFAGQAGLESLSDADYLALRSKRQVGHLPQLAPGGPTVSDTQKDTAEEGDDSMAVRIQSTLFDLVSYCQADAFTVSRALRSQDPTQRVRRLTLSETSEVRFKPLDVCSCAISPSTLRKQT